jgi:uncharacterized protein
LIRRSIYLDRISPLLGSPLIKVITGMRRVGKTELMRQVQGELISSGVKPEQICAIDMEDLAFDSIVRYPDLVSHVESHFKSLKRGKRKYLFVDEVQDIAEWERAIRHFSKKDEFEVFITGSNSTMLSSELSTYLAGRYIEVNVYPLSYREYLAFCPNSNFDEFSRLGGLPGVVTLPNEAARVSALEGISNTVLFRDVVARFSIRNPALLSDVLKFLSANIGYPTSTKSIADYLKKERISAAFETVRDYLLYFEQANLVACVKWYDALGKRSLDLNAKYYFTDIGLRNRLSGMRNEFRGQILENIVYNELRVRGYNVNIVRIGAMEVDFMAERTSARSTEKIYIQVTYLLASEETVKREFMPLLTIPDAYPKLVLSMDTAWGGDYDGVKREYLVDWLLDPAYI